jgi:hypothetical protein
MISLFEQVGTVQDGMNTLSRPMRLWTVRMPSLCAWVR